MLPAFQEQFRQAVVSMIADPEYSETFAYFLAAYEYRRQFPWLEEHQPRRRKQNGLAAALQTALAIYIVPSQESTVQPVSLHDPARYQPSKRAIGSERVDEFMLAVTATIEEGLSLERFKQRLARATVNVETVASDVLQKHIAGALSNYYQQRNTGLSPDPL